MAGDRQQQAERLRQMAEGRRRDVYEYAWPDEMPAIIEALEAGASALAHEQEILELVTDTYAEDYRRIVDRIRAILEIPR